MKISIKTKLRIRFVLYSLLALTLLLVTIVSVSILHNYGDMVKKSDLMLSRLHRNPDTGSRYFSVRIPADSHAVYPDVPKYVSISSEEAAKAAKTVLETGEDQGFWENYRYGVFRSEGGTRIYFLSRASALETFADGAENLILVSLVGLLTAAAVLTALSGRVVEPLMVSHRKQKQFISAASHELKTPLTVADTCAQLLESEIGENEWLSGIRKQVKRLTEMTADLVTLSKMEEYEAPLKKASFSLSDALLDAVETYRAATEQKQIEVRTETEEITYLGSEEEICHMLGILTDNACKYCPQGGRIRIRAKKSLHGVILTVTNTSSLSSSEDLAPLTGRFRRGSNAADQKGFGLGLSIAEAVAVRHGGSLSLSLTDGREFSVRVHLK